MHLRQILFRVYRKFQGQIKVKLMTDIGNEHYEINITELPLIEIYKILYFNKVTLNEFEKNKKKIVATCYAYRDIAFLTYPNSIRVTRIIYLYTDRLTSKFHGCHFIEEFLQHSIQSLKNNIEYETDGNHLIANYEAIITYYSFVKNDEKKVGAYSEKLEKSICEQVLNDGVHYEKSHMYHRVVLNHFFKIRYSLAFMNIQSSILDDSIVSMLLFEEFIANDSVMLGFGDSVDGLYDFEEYFINKARFAGVKELKNKQIIQRSLNVGFHKCEGFEVSFFKSSGLLVVKIKDYIAAFNFGNIKAANVPGHSHADELAFELYKGSTRLVGSLGVSTYSNSNNRHIERSSESKSTTLSNRLENHSEVWASFRVARKATISIKHVESNGKEFKIIASLMPVSKRQSYTREVLVNNTSITVKDTSNKEFWSQYIMMNDLRFDSKNKDISNKVSAHEGFNTAPTERTKTILLSNNELETTFRVTL
jgi:hypothetical protein